MGMNRTKLFILGTTLVVVTAGWLSYLKMGEVDRLEVRSYLGDTDATYHLGRMYLSGQGVAPDSQKGLRMIMDAAYDGNPTALVDMGQRYLEGIGMDKDESRALDYFIKAAEAGDSEGMFQASLMYKNGKGGWQLTKDKAAELMLASAEAGNRKACYQLIVGEMDEAKNRYWTIRAAELGDSEACFKLGGTYFSNNDAVNGLYWYVKAIEHGNSKDAVEGYIAWTIAMRYKKGEDMPLDEAEAYAWLNIAGINNFDYRMNRDNYAKQLDSETIRRGQLRSSELIALIKKGKAAESLRR